MFALKPSRLVVLTSMDHNARPTAFHSSVPSVSIIQTCKHAWATSTK